MSMWKDSTASRPTPVPIPEPIRADTPTKPQYTPVAAAAPLPHADTGLPRKESLIAPDITIEGKIEGSGSVRVAGKFKGDVNVQGDLTIEAGAKLTGSVRADKVTIAGELEGNIDESSRVDLQPTAVVSGDPGWRCDLGTGAVLMDADRRRDFALFRYSLVRDLAVMRP